MKKLLLLIAGFILVTPLAQAQDFHDVHDEHYNADAIDYLEEEAIVQGYPDGSYKPDNRINRAEFTKIIVEASYADEEIEACDTGSFPDVPAGEWFSKYVCMAKEHGIVGGYPDGTFKPANFINFAESSKIVSETLDVAPDTAGTAGEWFAGYVKGLENVKAIPSTVQFFDKEITRGEMSEVVFRVKDERQDKVSGTYEEITDPFPTIASCQALEDKFAHYNSRYDYYYLEEAEADVAFSSSPTAGASVATSARSESASDFSQTNVQVSGVDEADIIKNDGKYIYLVKEDTVRIIDAYPATGMNEVVEINFDDDGFRPSELYITDDEMVVIGRSSHYYYDYAGPEPAALSIWPPAYQSSQTKVLVYDISDRSAPKELREVAFDGNYNTSRRIDDQVYLVMNMHPDVWYYNRVEDGKSLLPTFIDGDSEPEYLVDCSDIRYFPGHELPQYLITASVSIDDPNEEIKRDVFLGSSENVYASRTHMYVASTVVDYGRYTDWDWVRDRSKTHVFRFALEDGEINFKARGEVPGRILNQFSMDAYINHFRIATTTGQTWNDNSENNLYVLDRDMNVVGSLEGLAPGESIFSTRFVGDRLYMVTFKKVDPLFVIDLKNPASPKLLGKLKIPGFSDYLHPYDEDHIIGFGKDAVEAKEGDFAWYQGFKMALFDVSDVNNPKEKFVELIGDRGTSSDLLQNHKALLFDKEKDLLAFPINISVKTEDQTDDHDFGVPSFSGALVYNLNLKDGFTERGRMTNYSEEDIFKLGDYWPYSSEKEIERIVQIGEYLYGVGPGMINSATLDEVEPVETLEF